MAILDTVKVNERKYDSLGVYYRPAFLSQEEVDLLSSYADSFKLEANKHESGFIKSNFIGTAPESYEGRDQVRATIGKIKDAIKSVYSVDNVYVNMMQNLVVTTAQSEGIGSQAFLSKTSDDKNGVIVKKFMLPGATLATPAWCVIIGLSKDDFETGGEVKVIDGVVEKINPGDVIWFRDDISTSYSIDDFDGPSASEEGGTPGTYTKSILDLTLTDLEDPSRFDG